MMELGLKGKRALVQGSSSGLGFAIAQTLAEEGAKVAVASSNPERVKKAAKEAGAAAFFAIDLDQKGGGTALVRSACEALGGLDILVTNTGGPKPAPFLELELSDWEAGFQKLYMSAVESISSALLIMKKQKYGRILLITSDAAKEPIPGLTLSNGFRSGLLGLMKSISSEVAPIGITVNSVLPGFIKTKRLKELQLDEKVVETIPARRFGEPSELAALCAFLVSDQARYITGQAISCDGGYLRSY